MSVCLSIVWLVAGVLLAGDSDHGGRRASPQRGYKLLRTKPYLPADFDDETFRSLWTAWPEPLRSQAEKANAAVRRRMAFTRYGLIEPPDSDGRQPAFGYVAGKNGTWRMSCFACHAGKVAGKTIPGAPNSHIDLQTLTEDVRKTKARLGKQWTHLDVASLKLPLSPTAGTTNSVIFGVLLGYVRDKDMNVDNTRKKPPILHHPMDAPAWWNVKKKRSLYVDGFAPKNHRVLMQFILLPQHGPATLKNWEPDFRDVLAYIESLNAPKYPWPIDEPLAKRGRVFFEKTCSRCHGTYGPNGRYKQKIVDIDVVKTDPVRLKALGREHRGWMKTGWMSRYGADPVDIDPGGYVAPPLDGVWSTAPYFHNGSVPTLWHVLHPDKRPTVWKRTENGYDQRRVGLEVEELRAVPGTAAKPAERRRYYDTSRYAHSARGHRFPDALSEDEKRAVLEYLKTL